MTENDSRHGRRSLGRRLFSFACLLATFALAFGAYSIWSGSQKTVTAQPAQATVPVQTTTVQAKSIEITRIGLGTVTPWQMVNITPQVSGRIVQIPFREGRDVKEGEVLVRIDPPPLPSGVGSGQGQERSGCRKPRQYREKS